MASRSIELTEVELVRVEPDPERREGGVPTPTRATSPGRGLRSPASASGHTSILHGDERKHIERAGIFGLIMFAYLACMYIMPQVVADPLKDNFGLVPSANLIFVAPMWILGTCIWRLAADCRTASIYGVGWLLSAFASFALGWACMQRNAIVVRDVSVRNWESRRADGYYFTDGYVGVEFQVDGSQRECAAGTQRCSYYTWSLAPVFASSQCALLNSTRQEEQREYDANGTLVSVVNATYPALNASQRESCGVLFVVLQVTPQHGVGIIGTMGIGEPTTRVLYNLLEPPDQEEMCGIGGSRGGLCTRLSPYSPHSCGESPLSTTTSRLPDPTLLGCAPRATCDELMAQPHLQSSFNTANMVCAKEYFAIGNLADAADDGRIIAAVMFILAALLFLAAIGSKIQKDVGLRAASDTLKKLLRATHRNVRQRAGACPTRQADMGV